MTNPDEMHQQKVERIRSAKSTEDGIMYARVKIISTGQVGIGGVSFDFPTRLSMILLDEDCDGGNSDGFVYISDREDLQMLCSACDAPALSKGRCAGCHQVWYCSTDCQKSHRSKHKKLCSKSKPKEVQVGFFHSHVDFHKFLLQKYAKASNIDSDSTTTDEAAETVHQVLDSIQKWLDNFSSVNQDSLQKWLDDRSAARLDDFIAANHAGDNDEDEEDCDVVN